MKFFLPFLAENTLTITLLSLIINYATLYFWQRDGFSMMEIAFISMITGIIFFFIALFLTWRTTQRYLAECRAEQLPALPIWQQTLLYSGTILLLACGLDYAFCTFIDDSIPRQFAQSLEQFMEQQGQDTTGIAEFAKMPLLLQNIATLAIGILMGNGIGGFIAYAKQQKQLLNH